MNVLAQFLNDKNMTQLEFARRMNYSPQYINNLVNGRNPITPAFILRVQVTFGPKASSLFLPMLGEKLTKVDNGLSDSEVTECGRPVISDLSTS